MDHKVDLQGRIMRRSSTGETYVRYGVMFVKRDKAQKEELDSLIRDLERGGVRDTLREEKTSQALSYEKRTMSRFHKTAPRYTLRHYVIVEDGKSVAQCQLVDVSRRGCFLRSTHHLKMGGTYPLKMKCMNSEIELKGKVIWKSEDRGYGIEFLHLKKSDQKHLHTLLRNLKKTGFQTRMHGSQSVNEEVFETSVMNTPYEMVILLKKVFMKDVKNTPQ
jgi:hypothetical protein